MKAPPGMDPAQAKAMMELLKANPEAAKNAWAQAQAVLQTPGMAQAMLSTMFAPPPPAATQEQFKVLQEDPELQDVMKDISANGISALQKYWDDTDLMMKISQKMGGLSLAGGSGAAAVPGVKEAPASASAAAGDDDADVPKAQKPTGHDNKVETTTQQQQFYRCLQHEELLQHCLRYFVLLQPVWCMPRNHCRLALRCLVGSLCMPWTALPPSRSSTHCQPWPCLLLTHPPACSFFLPPSAPLRRQTTHPGLETTCSSRPAYLTPPSRVTRLP